MNNIKEAISIIENYNYITPLKYISGRIVEYDIKSANITMLRNSKDISEDEYYFLSKLPKQDREIRVGNMIRENKLIYNHISDGIKDAKRELVKLNNINPNSIVRVANDAVYINSSVDLRVTRFNGIEFRPKSINTSLLQLDKLLIFCNCMNGIDIDVKGISEIDLMLHADYMLSFIGNIIYLIEKVSIEEALKEITIFYQNYINLNLPIGYYRELNSCSCFRIRMTSFLGNDFLVSNIDSLKDITIDYNLSIIRELWSIVLNKCYERRG